MTNKGLDQVIICLSLRCFLIIDLVLTRNVHDGGWGSEPVVDGLLFLLEEEMVEKQG